MAVRWDGITRRETLKEAAAQAREALADAAKNYNWPRVVALLVEDKDLVNTIRPDGLSWYAPLHQAAHGGAPVDVVQHLIDMGAFRTLKNARGERPVDVAERKGHRHVMAALTPQLTHQVPAGELIEMQGHFHTVIRGRARELVDEHALRLPELETLLELERPQMWFPVPGMYGGFSYWLESTGAVTKLVTESWCRIFGGSGQRHEITSRGCELVDEGFV